MKDRARLIFLVYFIHISYVHLLKDKGILFDRCFFVGKGFTGSISQFNVFTGHVANSTSEKCFNNVTGDVISWKVFEEILAPGVLVNVPSECDGAYVFLCHANWFIFPV
jgi:hypothetical protein